jgi:hypothetical protein
MDTLLSPNSSPDMLRCTSLSRPPPIPEEQQQTTAVAADSTAVHGELEDVFQDANKELLLSATYSTSESEAEDYIVT